MKKHEMELPYIVAEPIQLTHNTKTKKLEQLECIEEDLGIDLITLFMALENGIWSINETANGKKLFYEFVVCLGKDERGYYLTHKDSDYKCYLNDYGKTWVLTKEELK